MDEIVKQAMLKWPNVPDCYGWLGLDARGDWYMRDDRVQAQGAFSSGATGAKGSRLEHEGLVAFIARNYCADARGCWYFQNGPQRVYVELEVTPWVIRIEAENGLRTHTGLPVDYEAAWTDERGWLYLQTSVGIGVVHTQDVGLAADRISRGEWSLAHLSRDEIALRFGFVKSPASVGFQQG